MKSETTRASKASLRVLFRNALLLSMSTAVIMVVAALNAGRGSELAVIIQLIGAFAMIVGTARQWWNWHEAAFADRLTDE